MANTDNTSKWVKTGQHHFCFNCESWALYEEFSETECLSAYCPACGKRMENAEENAKSCAMCQEFDCDGCEFKR